MFPAMRATEQKTIGNVLIITPESTCISPEKVSMNSPHQPGCLTSSSRRAGQFPPPGARSLPLPLPRTGFLINGRNCAAKHKTTQEVFYHDAAQFCPPYSNNVLTFQLVRDYSPDQVLLTPKLKRYIASDNVIFYAHYF